MSEQVKRSRPPYPAEVRERAVRMVLDHQHEYPTQWKAIESVSAKLGINHETLRQWVRRAEVDAGARPGVTTAERERIKQPERENKELRRANEILKAAATFFGAELDRQSHKKSPSSTLTAPSSGSSRSAGCSPSTAARSLRTPTTPPANGRRRRGRYATRRSSR